MASERKRPAATLTARFDIVGTQRPDSDLANHTIEPRLFGPRTVALWERLSGERWTQDQNAPSMRRWPTISTSSPIAVRRAPGRRTNVHGSTPIAGFDQPSTPRAPYSTSECRRNTFGGDQLVAAARHRRLSSLVPGAELKASCCGILGKPFRSTWASDSCRSSYRGFYHPGRFQCRPHQSALEHGQLRYFHGSRSASAGCLIPCHQAPG